MYSVVHEWIYFVVDVCCSGFFATNRKNMRPLKPDKMKSDIVSFARKRYTITVNGISVSPSGFFVPSIANFRSMYRKLAGNQRYTLFGSFKKRHEK